jgi:hypothetical protein
VRSDTEIKILSPSGRKQCIFVRFIENSHCQTDRKNADCENAGTIELRESLKKTFEALKEKKDMLQSSILSGNPQSYKRKNSALEFPS